MKRFIRGILPALVVLLGWGAGPAPAAVKDIVTVAGGPIRDGVAGIKANVLYAAGVAADGAGNIYIADQGNNRIRRIGPDGIISTVAGSATGGYSGDSGPATAAALRMPTGVALDAAGNLYIADQGNNRIRKVSGGVITTLAGTGAGGSSGDGGPAISAALNSPFGVAVDKATGKVYFSDQLNHRVRMVAPDTGIITTVAGTGAAGGASAIAAPTPATSVPLNNPAGLAVASNGDLYIADMFNNRILKVTNPGPEGTVTAFAGDGSLGFAGDSGPATAAQLWWPSGVAVLGDDVFIADRNNQVLRKVSVGIITTFAGIHNKGDYSGDGGPPLLAMLKHPTGIAVDPAGNVYWTESGSDTVRTVTAATGIVSTVAGGGSGDYDGDGNPATETSLGMFPWSVALKGGDLYITDRNRIRMVSAANGRMSTAAGSGVGGYVDGPATSARLGIARGVAVDETTGKVYIADTANNRIRMLAAGRVTTIAGTGLGDYTGDGGPATSATMNFPSAIACDGAGNIYFADEGNNRVRKISPDGNIATVAGNGLPTPPANEGPATAVSLNRPSGVAVDKSGNLYIADMNNNRILKVAGGWLSTVAGTGSAGYNSDNISATSANLYYPAGVAVDGAGNLYIADQYNHRVRKVSTDGIITTVAGNGMWNYAGDNGPATEASLAYPNSVTVDRYGNLYIADRRNKCVRKVFGVAAAVPPPPATLSATAGDSRATVTFSRPASDGGSAITGYTVASHPAGGTDSNAGSAALSHVVTGLTNGTPYTFTVTATNAVGSGDPSLPSGSVTPATIPGAPVIGVAAPGNTAATVNFTPPVSDGGSAITGYTVESAPAGGVDTGAGTTALSHVITGLSNGVPYTFTVTATNAVGTGAASAPSNAVTPATVPGAPVIRTAVGSNSRATVTFSAPASNGGSPITGYTVTSSPAGGIDLHAGKTLLSHIVTGLKNGTRYTFTVRASNAVGPGQPSAPSGVVIPSALPGAPVIGKAKGWNAQATVTFSPPASHGGSPITGYRVTSHPAGGVDLHAGKTGLTHIVAGLKNGTAYYFTVAATNAVGTGPSSAISNKVFPGTVPGAPVIRTAKAGIGKATITLSPPASNGGSPITGYRVTSNPAGGVDLFAGKTALTHVVTGLKNGTAYTFTVTATNAYGTGNPSAPSKTLVTPTLPGAPVMGSAKAGKGQATVAFTPPASNGGAPITGYKVISNPAGGVDLYAGKTALTHLITGLKSGVAYTFTVTAANAIGTGPPSAPSNKVVPAAVASAAPMPAATLATTAPR